MSDLKIEATEPDPSATSLPNDQIINTEAGDSSESSIKDTDMAHSKPVNGEAGDEAAVVKEEAVGNNEAVVEEGSPEKKGEIGNGVQKDNRHSDENGGLKTHAHEGWNDSKKNSKYDPSILPHTNDPSTIRAQVEFYFSDTNMPSDKHMMSLTGGPDNRPVPLWKICGFGRMKRFQSQSTVVAALRQSNFLVVSGPEGKEEVRRAFAYDPTAPKSKSESRSIYAKGFGDEEPGSQFDIEAFFAPYGPTNEVRLRRDKDKRFKGSVFVEFQDEETAKKFLDLDPKPLWKGNTLLIKSKRTYMDEKEEDIKSGKIEPMEQRNFRRNYGRGRGGDSHKNDRRGGRRDAHGEGGDRDPDDWRKRREDDRASGFRGNRKDDRGRGRGRDNNRGGRGNRRDNRGKDRNRERGDKEKASTEDLQFEDSPVKIEDSSEKNDPREEGGEESAAKKVDNKPASNGNKRAREDDASEEKPAKKVDIESDS